VGTFAGTASADGVNAPVGGDSTWVIAGPHPADNSGDWRLGINEVTAYAAAWRTGGVWVIEPNPIPMSYVTRAAALWREGESYTVDPAVSAPPLCWMNTAAVADAPVQLAMVQRGISQRSLPAGFVAAEAVAVALNVRPATGTSAYAVEEALPAGAALVSVSEGGVLDPVHHLLKWGPFFDSSARLLHYQVVVAQGGTLQFTGSASFDGDVTVTQGPGELRSTSRINCESAPKDGRWTLRLSGDVGATYELQTSSDLQQWTSVTRVDNTTGTLVIPVATVPGSAQLYYRARLVTP
jgi:hypothetical protein